MADKTYNKGGRDHLGPHQGAAQTGKAVVNKITTSGGPSSSAQTSTQGKSQKIC